MTRITNFGRKRTYLQAGFAKSDVDETVKEAVVEAIQETVEEKPVEASNETESNPQPSKKPRKRRRKTKDPSAVREENEKEDGTSEKPTSEGQSSEKKAKTGMKRERQKEKVDKALRSEKRRLKRISEKQVNATCLACRKKGHLMKNCPEAGSALEATEESVMPTSGICYRCGSGRHTLARCRIPENPDNPLPFASCFVCSQRGHISAKCPKNSARGIYPNGGSCKLCQQTDHLAKDCPLRVKENASKSSMMLSGPTTEAGPDEDDFHILKRRRDFVQKEETILNKWATRVTAPPKPKPKVVVFK
ncbi:hypothetical protein M422DRAFT_32468 [Sphaerobolus stellatus SS14]|uniref:CCHC-type domain-containing protein n=1 Tax=Sphaerobolus stellatus (strain SS14) TaxID=990650 RepID=A0A0C9U9U8_SPHS4|nr:hypothetical protein M422DRAFT_32468 [Sphaerobolus stellatus SS14]